jgi:4-amino-4-deoxy-L-arabinose transferase-like glycosyltransferase
VAGIDERQERRGLLSWPVWLFAGVQVAALLATSTRYGWHRDEMYFVVAGSHPAAGYPDQPPLVPLLVHALYSLGSGSLFLVRLPSALAAGATTVLAALVAREIGGGRRAELIAAGSTAASGFALAVGHFVTTTTFDLLSTTVFLWLVVRALARREGWLLLPAGVVVGAGFEAKPQVGIVAVVAAAALLATGPRWPFRTWWTAAGAVAAVLLAAPYLAWQQRHGWPQVTVAGNIGGSAEGGRIGFVPFQLLLVSPVLVPVWVAGLVAPFRGRDLRALRFLPVTYLALLVIYVVGNGKAYYLGSLYPLLLGLGAVPVAAWTLRSRRSLSLLLAAIGVSAVVGAFIALPLLPERSLQGSVVMAINPDQGETVGWPRFVNAVAAAWRRIPPAERARTAIFTQNYGEAGAIDLLGGARSLPRAYSGHNGFSEWGRPGRSDAHALVVGFDGPADAAPLFASCRRVGRVDDGVGLENDEQGLPLLVCRPAGSWTALWPRLTHYN